MKKLTFLSALILGNFFAFSQNCVQNELTKKELAHLTNDAQTYTYLGSTYGNICDVTIQKSGTGPNLMSIFSNDNYSAEGFWVGKNNNKVDFTDITITFSKPITKLSFVMTAFNNDAGGREEIQDLRILTAEDINLTSGASFKWLTGSLSGFPPSMAGATVLDNTTKTISALEGKCCDASSGRLMIESQTPFTKLIFRHQELGSNPNPNGVIFSGPMDFCVIPPHPVAIDDHLLASHNTEVVHTITANDFDSISTINHETIDLDPHEIGMRTVKKVDGGIFSVKEAGKVTFTPDSNFTGTTQVNYTVKNKHKKTSNVATWKVVVGPNAKNDIAITSINTAINFDVCHNDLDVDALDHSSIDLNPSEDGQQSEFSIKDKGTFKADKNGTVVFEPAQNYVGNATAFYTVKDSKGAQSKPTQINVTVLGYFYYDLGKYDVNSKAKKELDKLVVLFKQYPKMKLEFGSHTDCIGKEEDNQILSQKRADGMLNYLVKKGVPQSQITGKGYGESNLVTSCACEENATSKCSETENQKNRRTEIKVLTLGN